MPALALFALIHVDLDFGAFARHEIGLGVQRMGKGRAGMQRGFVGTATRLRKGA